MISLDTNIIVRFLTHDSTPQYQQVLALFDELERDNKQAFISMLVLLEVIWVLAFSYKMNRSNIINHLLILMNMPIFDIENHITVMNVLINAKNNTFDLSDLLIACRSSVSDHTPVLTFDKKASKFEWFELLQ